MKGLTGLTCVTTSQAKTEEAHALNGGREAMPGREMEEVGRSLEQASEERRGLQVILRENRELRPNPSRH